MVEHRDGNQTAKGDMYHSNPNGDGERRPNERGRPMLDQDQMYLRRELVHQMNSQGLTTPQIVKRFLQDPELRPLLDCGYRMPLFRVVRNDIRWYHRNRERIAEEKQRVQGLEEFCDRMDAIFREAWKQLDRIGDAMSSHDVKVLLAIASKAASDKANALGIDTETGRESGGESGGGGNNTNIAVFGDPGQFMQFMQQVEQAKKLTAPVREEEAIEAEVL